MVGDSGANLTSPDGGNFTDQEVVKIPAVSGKEAADAEDSLEEKIEDAIENEIEKAEEKLEEVIEGLEIVGETIEVKEE